MNNDEYMKLYKQFKPMIIKLVHKWSKLNIIEFDGSILNSEALTGFPLFLARFKVAGLVSLTLFLGIIVAKFVGTSLPMLVASLKKDPALISSPFVTTIVDVCSLLIYLGFAYLIFGEFLGAL